MSDSLKVGSQLQGDDAKRIRRSVRPKTPSMLYADDFEDTQKLGRKNVVKSIKKESDIKVEVEENPDRPKTKIDTTTERLDWLPFIHPDDKIDGYIGSTLSVKYVTFKKIAVEEQKQIPAQKQANNVKEQGLTSDSSSHYQTRKIRKKPVFPDEYSFNHQKDKKKLKLKPTHQKSNKATQKINSPPQSNSTKQNFLDLVLMAAKKAQAQQNLSPQSPLSSKMSSQDGNQNNYISGTLSVSKSQKSMYEDHKGYERRQRNVSKKEAPRTSYSTDDEYNSKIAEKKDSFIQKANIKDDKIIFEHPKFPPIVMKYNRQKYTVKDSEIMNSKIFDIAIDPTMSADTFTSANNSTHELTEQDIKKRVKIKENILTLHFKELYRDHKPNILI